MSNDSNTYVLPFNSIVDHQSEKSYYEHDKSYAAFNSIVDHPIHVVSFVLDQFYSRSDFCSNY